MRLAIRLLLIAVSTIVLGCGDDSAPLDDDPRVLATVGNISISVSWFETTYVNFLIRSGGNDTERARYVHLDNLIDAILVSEYARGTDLEQNPDLLQFKQREEKSAIGGRFFDEEFLKTLPPPTDADLRETFVRWKDKVIVRHLFYTDPTLADAAYERLVNGRSFIDEAQDCYGLTVFDSLAGYLGPISYFNADDAFAETAFTMEAGSFSAPVRSRFGYHIIKVEDRIREPLLTESEFETRREGMSSQFRLRKRRLEGDRFVRDFMMQRKVSVDAAAIAGLQSLLQDFAIDVRPRTSIVQAGDPGFKMDSLRTALDPTTVLATYEYGGEQREFTAGDYASWLEDLPFQEALHRTAASLGRALRNEVFYLAGESKGYFDARAKKIVEREMIYRRSRMLREELRADLAAPIDSNLIKDTFSRIGLGQSKQYMFDFVAVEFESRRLAEEASALVLSGDARLEDYDDAIVVVQQKIDSFPAWRQVATTAPIGVPTVAGLAEGWGVIQVSRRDEIVLNWLDHKDEIVERLKPYAAEYNLVKSLRTGASIGVDSVLFKEIMIFDRLSGINQ